MQNYHPLRENNKPMPARSDQFKNIPARRAKLGNESGVILLVVLWILVILTIFAMGMGRRGQVDVALARYSLGQTRARYVAWSGIQYAAARILEDSSDKDSSGFDTINQCGFHLPESGSVEDLFKHVPATGGYFDITAPSSAKE